MKQEAFALTIVFLAALSLLFKWFRFALTDPLSVWLLQRGWVKLAMQIRQLSLSKSACSSCRK